MKKLLSAILSFLLIFSFAGCRSNTETQNNTTEQTSANEIDLLREKYPEYFNLGTFKGIEVYVWQTSENSFRCGALMGTNRNKTNEEIWDLFTHSVSADEMKKILSTYSIAKNDINIIPCIQPLSSYIYTIDKTFIHKLEKMFKGYPIVTISTLNNDFQINNNTKNNN